MDLSSKENGIFDKADPSPATAMCKIFTRGLLEPPFLLPMVYNTRIVAKNKNEGQPRVELLVMGKPKKISRNYSSFSSVSHLGHSKSILSIDNMHPPTHLIPRSNKPQNNLDPRNMH